MKLGRMKAENGYFRTIVQEKDGKRYDLSRIFATFHRQLGLTSLGFRREPILLAKQGQSLSEFWKYALAVVSQENDLSEFVVPEMLPLVCPLKPNRILAIGRNYGEHARELGNAIPEEPIVFMKPASCVIGPDEPIEIPDWVGRVDYEGELLVIIGKGGKNITEANAMDHVAAYSLFNDVTAREKQRAAQEKKQPWFLAKSLDTFGPLGPYLVTGDEVPDPHNLQLTLTVNGEMKQNGSTGSMIYSIPFLISYLSKWIALEEGDVIATGTPSGVGPLHPGDVVELTIEGLGTLRNPVVAI